MQVVLRAHVMGLGVVEGTSDVEWAEIVDIEDAHFLVTLDAATSMNRTPSQDELNIALGRLLLGHLRRRAAQNEEPDALLEMCLRRLVRHGRSIPKNDECRSASPTAFCLTTIQNATSIDQAGDHEVLCDG